MGIALSMVGFSPSIEQRKQVYNYEVNDLDVSVVYNEWIELLMCLQALVNKSYTW